MIDVGEDGNISGYGAVFGNVDSHGDIIERNAFSDTLNEWGRRSKLPKMLLMHSLGDSIQDQMPIGVWNHMHQDENGLYCEGKLALGNTYANDAYALIKAGAVDGLSIGYSPKQFTILPKGGPAKRKLSAVKLFEVSVVNEPSNDKARITRVKSKPVKYVRAGEENFMRALRNLAESLGEKV